MLKKRLLLFIIFILVSSFFFLFSIQPQRSTERGTFSIIFMEEKVGYEEYIWKTDETGYLLSVRGRMTKPIALEIDRLTIRLDRSFIPLRYTFKGSVSGVAQEIESSISEGEVESTILVAGQEQKSTVKIKRNSFLLPNAIFSPYLILTKKFRCTLQEKVEFSAYIIPQLEVTVSLKPKEEDPCTLIMQLSTLQIEVETNERGSLIALHIPSQNLIVVQDIHGAPIR